LLQTGIIIFVFHLTHTKKSWDRENLPPHHRHQNNLFTFRSNYIINKISNRLLALLSICQRFPIGPNYWRIQ